MTARLPSMVEQLLAIHTGKRRATIGRPFPPGMIPGRCTERVLLLLTTEYPRWLRRTEIEAIAGLTRNQASWACEYLLLRGEIRAQANPNHDGYRRYQAVAKHSRDD